MKIYDTHSDIFSNLYERKIKNENNIFENYHTEALAKGEVVGGIWVVYSEHDFDVEEAFDIALKEYEPYKDKYDVVYGLEGLRNVPDLACLKRLYDRGVRHAMLTWNEENHLATGVAGDKDHGLKELGKEFIDFMEANNMIVDVSHLNIKSFYEVMKYVTKPVIASHSCAYTLSDHRRNLNDDQLKVLKQNGGYVGVNSARNFVSKDRSLQTVKGLVDQIMYLIEHLDIDHVMLGLDMMDYLSDYGGDKKTGLNDNLDDLATHADCQNIIVELRNRGLSINDIEKIAFGNYLNMRKKLLNY